MAVHHPIVRKKIHKIAFFILGALVIFAYQTNAFAGAAVQAQRQKQARREQLIRERQLLQQRVQQQVQQQVQSTVSQQAQSQMQQQLKSAAQQKAQSIANQQAQVLSSQGRPNASAPAAAIASEHVPVETIWQKLDHSSELWRQVVKPADKNKIVIHYVNAYRNQGISITREPSRYSALIDDMVQSNPSLLSNPFPDVLRVVAIMEYDYNNGQDRDMLARQVLGEKGYIANKTRLNSR